MDDPNKIYQATEPNIVYSTPASQEVHILHGGQGKPDGPGHLHTIYNPVKDTVREAPRK
jgi:hypothetical protein